MPASCVEGGLTVAAGYEGAVRLLIRLLHDGEMGFREVARMLRGEAYRRFFLEESAVRAALAAELERALASVMGTAVREDGTLMGALHRTYFELRDAMGADDETLLELSAQCERVLARVYLDVLAKQMPEGLRAVLEQQDGHIRRVYAMMQRYCADARLAAQ